MCQVYVLHVISPGELYVQREEEGVVDPEVKLRYTINKLHGSLSETEMILEDPEFGMPCCVNEGYEGTKTSSVTTLTQLVDAMCRLAPLAIQCCLAGVYQNDVKGRMRSTDFLTSDILPYTVALSATK